MKNQTYFRNIRKLFHTNAAFSIWWDTELQHSNIRGVLGGWVRYGRKYETGRYKRLILVDNESGIQTGYSFYVEITINFFVSYSQVSSIVRLGRCPTQAVTLKESTTKVMGFLTGHIISDILEEIDEELRKCGWCFLEDVLKSLKSIY